jgi:hypothetical protein
MDKAKKIEIHKQVSERLEKAANCHRKATEFLENDKREEAAHASMTAYGHILHAKELIQSVAKCCADKDV